MGNARWVRGAAAAPRPGQRGFGLMFPDFGGCRFAGAAVAVVRDACGCGTFTSSSPSHNSGRRDRSANRIRSSTQGSY